MVNSGRIRLVLAVLGFLLLASPLCAVAQQESTVKFYVVPAPRAGERIETVPDVARRLLGNRNRATEIVRLNENRVQPDGAKLTGNGALRAGWVLVLPRDAAGTGVRVGRQPREAPTPSSSPPSTTKPAETKPAQQAKPEQPNGTRDLVLGGGALGLAVLGGGTWVLVRRSRRRPVDVAAHVEPVPVVAGFDEYELVLGGARVSATLAPSVAASVRFGQSAGESAGVCLGENEDGFLHLDLIRTRGVIAVCGDHDSADQLVELVLRESSLAATVLGPVAAGVAESARVDRLGGVAEFDPEPNAAPRLVAWAPGVPVRARDVEFLTSGERTRVIPLVLGDVPDAPVRLRVEAVESTGRHATAR